MTKPAILYDSLCRLCNAEIEYYKKNDIQKIFEYIDIMDPKFDPNEYKLTKSDVHKYFHLKDENGNLLKGVEAFNYIWIRLNKFKMLQKMYTFSFGKKIMEVGYQGFVLARPYLPRKKACDDYCEL
jgi:predicted DCC family thiol-disulfide oxidoreductase YuxK